MKKYLIVELLLISLFSCTLDSSENPTNRYLWVPILGSGMGDKTVTIYFTDPRPIANYVAPGPENPEYFNLLISEDLVKFKIFQRLDAFTDSLKITNLSNGKPYYFKVSAQKKNLDSVGSNTVMTIPSIMSKIEKYSLDVNFSMENAKFSSDRRYVAFYSDDYNGGNNARDLLLMDTATNEVSTIAQDVNMGNWNPTKNTLVYGSSTSAGGNLSKYKLMVYEVETKTSMELFSMVSSNLLIGLVNPLFTPDGKHVSYLLNNDRSEGVRYELWTYDLETKEPLKISNFEGDGFHTFGGYGWGTTGSELYIQGNYDIQHGEDNIYKFEPDSKSLIPIIESLWDNGWPSISPNGTKIAFLSYRGGNPVWIYDLETSKLRELAKMTMLGGMPSLPQWADGDHLLIPIYNKGINRWEINTIAVE